MKVLLQFVLFLVLFLQLILSAAFVGITFDEAAHILAGYSYWLTGDFSLNQEHPPVMKLLAGIPLLFLKPAFPAGETDQWRLGQQFFFEKNNNPDTILFLARLPIIIITLLLALFVYLWAQQLYGRSAGLFALFLLTFEPNILAHGILVTTDVGVTAFLFIMLYFFWRWLAQPSWKNTLICAMVLGLTLSAKFSGIYALPILAALLFMHVYARKKHKARPVFIRFVTLVLLALLVLSATYFFVHTPTYVNGLKTVIQQSQQGRHSFLFGEYSTKGWWYYFPLAFLIKTPVPLFFLLVLSVFFPSRKHTLKEAFLLIPVLFWFVIFSFNHMNIGLRHVLPVYPFLIVFASRFVGTKFVAQRFVRVGLGFLGFWLVASSVFLFPNYLSFFNELIGGPSQGDKYLIDSNIDWGQNLKGLKHWMDVNNITTISLAYFGQDNPAFRGIHAQSFLCYPTKGVVAISATFLRGFTEQQKQCARWLHTRIPLARIGYSMYVYSINETHTAEELCPTLCKPQCAEVHKAYNSSMLVGDACKCLCS